MVWILNNFKKDLAKSLVAFNLAIRLLMFQDLTLRKEQAIYNALICPVFQSTSTFYLSNYLHYSKTDHHNSLGGGGVAELLNLLL